jgi:hypothetical protein
MNCVADGFTCMKGRTPTQGLVGASRTASLVDGKAPGRSKDSPLSWNLVERGEISSGVGWIISAHGLVAL